MPNITCTTMSLVCTVFMLAKSILYIRPDLQFIVICNILLFGISNLIFFFRFQHLFIDNSHILLVIVFYTIVRDTLTR